jgi:hypothetical protein
MVLWISVLRNGVRSVQVLLGRPSGTLSSSMAGCLRALSLRSLPVSVTAVWRGGRFKIDSHPAPCVPRDALYSERCLASSLAYRYGLLWMLRAGGDSAPSCRPTHPHLWRKLSSA